MDGIQALVFLALLLIVPGTAWALLVQTLKRQNLPGWLLHLLGFIDAILVALATLAWLAMRDTPTAVIFGLVCVSQVGIWWTTTHPAQPKPKPEEQPTVKPESKPVPAPKPATPSEFKPAPPLPKGWNTRLTFGQPEKPKVERKRRKARDGIDTILFTYTDSQGETTERRVIVHEVDTSYIKGYCTDRRAARTFRIDRIDSHIISESTGEVVPAWEWAARHW